MVLNIQYLNNDSSMMPLPYVRICTSSAKYCQVFPYSPYMEWFCTQRVATETTDNKIFNLNMV